MTGLFVIACDLPTQKFCDFQKTVADVKKLLIPIESRQDDTIRSIASHTLDTVIRLKPSLENDRSILKSQKVIIARLERGIPFLESPFKEIPDSLKEIQKLQLCLWRTKQKNKELMLLVQSPLYKSALTLCKGTIKTCEGILASRKPDQNQLLEQCKEAISTITEQQKEVHHLQDSHLVSQIKILHVELLSFLASKVPGQDLTALITSIQQIDGGGQGAPQNRQIFQEAIKTVLQPHLSFQGATGVFHWLKENVFYKSIKDSISALEDQARELQIIHDRLKDRCDPFFCGDFAPKEGFTSIEEEYSFYAEALPNIELAIKTLLAKLLEQKFTQPIHAGLYYGSHLLAFLAELRRSLILFETMIRADNQKIFKIHTLVIDYLKTAASPFILPQEIRQLAVAAQAIRSIPIPQKKKGDFVHSQGRTLLLLFEQIVAKRGRETLKKEDLLYQPLYKQVIRRQPLNQYDQHNLEGLLEKEIVKGLYFAPNFSWQLDLMMPAANPRGSSKILPLYKKKTPAVIQKFSDFFYEVDIYEELKKIDTRQKLFSYAKSCLIFESCKENYTQEGEALFIQAQETLEKIRQENRWPVLQPKPQKDVVEPPEDSSSSNRHFTLVARALWGQPLEQVEASCELIQIFQNDAPKVEFPSTLQPLYDFFLFKRALDSDVVATEYEKELLSGVLQRYVQDLSNLGSALHKEHGIEACEKLLYSRRKQLITFIKNHRGENGFEQWVQAFTNSQQSETIAELLNEDCGNYRFFIKALLAKT